MPLVVVPEDQGQAERPFLLAEVSVKTTQRCRPSCGVSWPVLGLLIPAARCRRGALPVCVLGDLGQHGPILESGCIQQLVQVVGPASMAGAWSRAWSTVL